MPAAAVPARVGAVAQGAEVRAQRVALALAAWARAGMQA
jgi:hypothetical protein